MKHGTAKAVSPKHNSPGLVNTGACAIPAFIPSRENTRAAACPAALLKHLKIPAIRHSVLGEKSIFEIVKKIMHPSIRASRIGNTKTP
jgi:hypothetical protein